MAPTMNVESFNLDHRLVKAPYIRVADRKELTEGVVLTKFDLRLTQPNREHLDTEAIHSLEHMMAEKARDHADNIIDISPMGCRTGFYMLVNGDMTAEQIAPLVEQTLADVLEASEVPAANDVQCGWGEHHSLEGAKQAAKAFLEQRAHWLDVGV